MSSLAHAPTAGCINLRPGFPAGLRVLVLGHSAQLSPADELAMKEAAYEVSRCCDASSAVAMLRKDAELADVVLVEARSPRCPRSPNWSD